MQTITKVKSRIPDFQTNRSSVSTDSIDSLLWHIALYHTVSENDKECLLQLAPENCSIFLIENKKLMYHAEKLSNCIHTIQNEINISHDATFVQTIFDEHQRDLRVLTIPLDKNLCIGLVIPTSLHTVSDIEDTFLHKAYNLKNNYTLIKNSLDKMSETANCSDPILVINRKDGQLLAWNNSSITFFNLSQEKLLNASLQSLQIKSPKTSHRKMHITNSLIGNTECSVVRYALNASDKIDDNYFSLELKSHAEQLLTLYRELQTVENVDQKLIQEKITEIITLTKSITNLHKTEKKE